MGIKLNNKLGGLFNKTKNITDINNGGNKTNEPIFDAEVIIFRYNNFEDRYVEMDTAIIKSRNDVRSILGVGVGETLSIHLKRGIMVYACKVDKAGVGHMTAHTTDCGGGLHFWAGDFIVCKLGENSLPVDIDEFTVFQTVKSIIADGINDINICKLRSDTKELADNSDISEDIINNESTASDNIKYPCMDFEGVLEGLIYRRDKDNEFTDNTDITEE